MNREVEENFVKNYIVSNRRERLMHELQGKKRTDGVRRFCHHTDKLITESTIRSKGQYILPDLQDALAKAESDKCYVISFFEDIDGTEMNKNEALQTIIGRGMPSILICDDFVIIETEQEQGPAMKYLLHK